MASVSGFLAAAEVLEREAAVGRAAYYDELASPAPGEAGPRLDVGCGNGYTVARWRQNGHRAFGIDRSLYRLSRWREEHPGGAPLLVADATALPFPGATFSLVVSSGMIEHVGVEEEPNPYRVRALPQRDTARAAVVAEMSRVAAARGRVFLDCPNGAFPIDFWHGSSLGSFRLHPLPDVLLPTFGQLRRWSAAAGAEARLVPLGSRLRFRQIRHRWWGRLLAPAAQLAQRLLDLGIGAGLGRLLAPLLPYLVVEVRRC